MDIHAKAAQLVQYIKQLDGFYIDSDIDGGYNHIGATITDAILQAGISYNTVVKPRVDKLMVNYPEASTTTGFIRLFERIDIQELLNFGGLKPKRIADIAYFFLNEAIETEEDLKSWLSVTENISKLRKLNGVGPKTADYFKILVGIETNAIDRHLENFVKDASIIASGYKEHQELIYEAADSLGVNRSHLDYSIWKYMSEKKRGAV